jgi:Pro-kumamolisin, activation domain
MLTIFHYYLSLGNSSTIITEIKTEEVEIHVFKEFAAGLSSRADLVKRERVSHDHIHEVIFAIQQMNVNKLTELLQDVSDPDSPNYGKHRSRDEIEEIASNPASRNFLLQFLQNLGATIVSESMFGEYVTAKAPVSVYHCLNAPRPPR